MTFTSPRLNALRTVLYAMHGREPSHLEMIRLFALLFKRALD